MSLHSYNERSGCWTGSVAAGQLVASASLAKKILLTEIFCTQQFKLERKVHSLSIMEHHQARALRWADELYLPLHTTADATRTTVHTALPVSSALPARSAMRKRSAAAAALTHPRGADTPKRMKSTPAVATSAAAASAAAAAAAVEATVPAPLLLDEAPDRTAAAAITKERMVRALQQAMAADPEAGKRLRQQKAEQLMQQLKQKRRVAMEEALRISRSR
jgi:hypothetical protein